MSKSGKPLTNRAPKVKGVLRKVVNLILVLVLLVQMAPLQAFAAWDGKGSTSDSGSTQVTGTYSADDVSLTGYRFSIHSLETGEKLGVSIDIDFLRWGIGGYRAYQEDKMSHIEIYKAYAAGETPDIHKNYGLEYRTWNTNPDSEYYYKTYIAKYPDDLYFESNLRSLDPTEIGGNGEDDTTWLNDTRCWEIAKLCAAQQYYNPKTCAIICEPIYHVVLENQVFNYTIAELAVYQSTQCGWDTIPSLVKGTYMNDIGRLTSGSWPRQLYAIGQYDALGTTPVVENDDFLKTYTHNNASVDYIHLPNSTSRRNTAAELLQYQVGMGVYTSRPPDNEYTLTVDPQGGDWTPPGDYDSEEGVYKTKYGTWAYDSADGTWSVKILEGQTLDIEDPVLDGKVFSGWKVEGSGTIADGSYTQGAGNCRLTAQWVETSVTVNFYRQDNPDDLSCGATKFQFLSMQLAPPVNGCSQEALLLSR